MKDENDLAIAGQLPEDPEEGTTVVVMPSKKEDPNAPRVLTVKQLLEASAARALRNDTIVRCTSGVYKIDDATGGMRPGHCWLFGAESNWGKSSWGVMVLDENLRRGIRVLIVSSEDDEAIYGDRLLARRAEIDAKALRDRRRRDWYRDKIQEEIRNAENVPAFLDAREKTVEWVAHHVDRLIVSEGIDLVLYDYLQEFGVSKRQEDHRLEVKYAAQVLRRVVKKHKRSCVIFSQLTIDPKMTKTYPDRTMIRDCRDVANAAEVILLGYTPKQNVTDSKGNIVVVGGQKAVFIDKVKDGPKGFAVGLDWNEDTASFTRIKPPPGEYDIFDDMAEIAEEFDIADN